MVLAIQKISLNDKKYPTLLKEATGAPKTLFYLGILPSSKEKNIIAIVGTRKATDHGKQIAKRIANIYVSLTQTDTQKIQILTCYMRNYKYGIHNLEQNIFHD